VIYGSPPVFFFESRSRPAFGVRADHEKTPGTAATRRLPVNSSSQPQNPYSLNSATTAIRIRPGTAAFVPGVFPGNAGADFDLFGEPAAVVVVVVPISIGGHLIVLRRVAAAVAVAVGVEGQRGAVVVVGLSAGITEKTMTPDPNGTVLCLVWG
jgi:hypothetical protein